MFNDILELLLSLTIILFCCELFTNGIEWFGKKLNLGDGVVGSILSAIGTCLPETIIPVTAILISIDSKKGTDIGIGAIIGAPFMLGTLAFFLTGFSVVIFNRKRKTGFKMMVSYKILRRDIGFFIIIYTMGISAGFIDSDTIKYIIAAILPISYIFYIILTIRSDKQSNHSIESLYIVSMLQVKPLMFFVILQLMIALLGIIIGAETFVNCIKGFALIFGVSPLVLSMIIAPIATELPEKFNSIIWISKKKDTLALGNITGAMVFQSCIPVSIGIIATPWTLDAKAFISALFAIMSASVVYFWIKLKGRLSPVPLMTGGIFYSVFIAYLLGTGFK